jgi:hypothetical protein
VKQSFVVLSAAVALAGCASYGPSVPPDYTGPTATVKDSATIYSSSKADLFYVSHVDGKEIENSRVKTARGNRGRILAMTPVVVQNPIPARATAVRIVGRTEYSAPFMALARTVYEIKGDVKFVPEADKSYVVRGELGENYSAVWIEEESSYAVVGKKIEVRGSAELGILQK